MVVTIHDITFRLFPQWIAPRPRKLMNFLIPLAAQSASKIITCSQCSKNDMVRELGLPAEKIVVTPYAASSHFWPHDPQEAHGRVREAYPQLSNDFVAGIGLRGPRKNIGVVLRAILRLRARGAWPAEMKFAIAGSREQFPDEELQKLGDIVVFLGFVDEALLPYIFAAAQCTVYPSLYEGFGLPVLEAMACGCPVICSNSSSLPEVAGGAAAMLSPTDEEGWASVLESVLHDDNHRAMLRSWGLERAAQFSWEKCARQTLDVYKEVAGDARG
jgi:glycosyltransferase involved in cell wall biosynthesis